MIDVLRGEALPRRTVLICGDRIAGVDPATEAEIPHESEIVDAKGLYLIPGLFDAHVHLSSVDDSARSTLALLLIANGVTFVRDMGGDTWTVLTLRDRVASGSLHGPEMIVTGQTLNGNPEAYRSHLICETVQKARWAVRMLAERGVDQIKVYSGLGEEVYRAIMEAAEARGLKVVGHVPRSISLEDVVEAGQASTEHLDGWPSLLSDWADDYEARGAEVDLSEASMKWVGWERKIPARRWAVFVRKLRDSGMVICPTLVTTDRIVRLEDPALRRDPALKYVPSARRVGWDKRIKRWKKARQYSSSDGEKPRMRALLVRRLHDAGVPLVCGTDLGGLPYLVAGFSLHEEMELFQSAGIPPSAVLRAATINGARLCDVDHRLGSVSRGKTASLVLLRRNPLEDVRNASEIEGVFLKGEFFDRKRLDALLESVRISSE